MTKDFKLLLVSKNISNINELANKAGVNKTTIYRLFKNKKSRVETLLKISKALDLNAEEIDHYFYSA